MNSARSSRYSLQTRVVAVFFLALVAYNEWLSLVFNQLLWSSLPDAEGYRKEVRILLVADPQIQGYKNEPAGLLGAITRWDADRYLHRSFVAAVNHVEPEVILFLGDHLDEGSIATKNEFEAYKQRFVRLFRIPEHIKVISIPGDNDIGGEMEAVQPDKQHRFDEWFGREERVVYGFLEFVKVNYMTAHIPMVPPKNNSLLRIVVSHIPLLAFSISFSHQVLNQLSPDLFITAHEHISQVVNANRTTGDLIELNPMELSRRIVDLHLHNDDPLHEIMVPTCSYRMGVRYMGYGAALIGSDGIIHYTVLWLPRRFPQLFMYLVAIVIAAALFILPFLCRCAHQVCCVRPSTVGRYL